MLKSGEKQKYNHYLSMQNIIKVMLDISWNKNKSDVRCQYFLLLTVMKLCSNKVTYIAPSDIV